MILDTIVEEISFLTGEKIIERVKDKRLDAFLAQLKKATEDDFFNSVFYI